MNLFKDKNTLLIIALVVVVVILWKRSKKNKSSYDPTDGNWDMDEHGGWSGYEGMRGIYAAPKQNYLADYAGDLQPREAGYNAGLYFHSFNAPYTPTGKYGATLRSEQPYQNVAEFRAGYE